MSDDLRRRIHLDDLSVRLTGVDPEIARAVTTRLPAAIRAHLAGQSPQAVQARPGTVADLTSRLASEIAERIEPHVTTRRTGD